MDSEKLRNSITEAVITTFMDMAFIDAMPRDSCESESVEFSHIIHIDFKAPTEGSLILYLPTACKRMIVENIHGNDWLELSADEIDDCLLEVLNVLAGNFLRNYCGEELTHNMSFPEILFDESDIPDKSAYEEFCFDGEGVLFKTAIAITD